MFSGKKHAALSTFSNSAIIFRACPRPLNPRVLAPAFGHTADIVRLQIRKKSSQLRNRRIHPVTLSLVRQVNGIPATEISLKYAVCRRLAERGVPDLGCIVAKTEAIQPLIL